MENHDFAPNLTKTNKQFYSRKKKTFQIHINTSIKAEKTLQFLLNQRLPKHTKPHLCLTEQS